MIEIGMVIMTLMTDRRIVEGFPSRAARELHEWRVRVPLWRKLLQRLSRLYREGAGR